MTPQDDDGPRFAVLLCTHNGQAFLAEQLASVLGQSRPPACLFVHDWGSSDGTLAIVEQARAAALSVCHWEVVAHPGAPGVTLSFLTGLQQCMASAQSFDYLFFCDQDDVWLPHKLQAFADTLAVQPGLDLLYSDVCLIDAQGQVIAEHYLGPGGAFGRPMDIAHPATMFVNTVSGMSMALSRGFLTRWQHAWQMDGWFMHDWAMTIVACLAQARSAFIAQPLVAYRQHGGNLVGSLGGHRGRRRLADIWRQARADVQRVAHQYKACAEQLDLGRVPALKPPLSGFAVAGLILRGRSFRWPKTLKVALGYLLFWPD